MIAEKNHGLARAAFCALTDYGLLAFSGEDAPAFLHGQLTSDVASLEPSCTQYSGYCSPKGRLLATPLLWRLEKEILLQLPASLLEAIQARLSRYVLRSRVKISDATSRYLLYGVAGEAAPALLKMFAKKSPTSPHEVVSEDGLRIAHLPGDRYLVLAAPDCPERVTASLREHAQAKNDDYWARLDIQSGIPMIRSETQEKYIPQMVNLDAIGGIAYTKGCYPGQEVVARTHYLGKLKQRMFYVHLTTIEAPRRGDPLFSAQFGADQASGAILDTTPAEDEGYDALAVIQTSAVSAGAVHWNRLDGPTVEIRDLPYSSIL